MEEFRGGNEIARVLIISIIELQSVNDHCNHILKYSFLKDDFVNVKNLYTDFHQVIVLGAFMQQARVFDCSQQWFNSLANSFFPVKQCISLATLLYRKWNNHYITIHLSLSHWTFGYHKNIMWFPISHALVKFTGEYIKELPALK